MKYIANPVVVDAFQIIAVGDEDPSIDLAIPPRTLTLENGRTVTATPMMLARMTPVVGDYWVIQEDGYIYLNPKAVFERKYSPQPQYPITMYRVTGNTIEQTGGIIDAAHEAIAAQNGWSREKPALPAQSPIPTLEERLAALEAKYGKA